MAITGAAVSLQDFITSLDETCLPRILQVCSGVYFQGSVYELSGSEVCLSTGDILKVIGIDLLSVRCEDISSNDVFELPLTYPGLFKLLPEEMPYNTVEEMIRLQPDGLNSCLHFTFTSRCEITLENFTLGAGRRITMLSTVERDGQETHVRCLVQEQHRVTREVLLPLTCRGEFYECDSDQRYALQEIMSSPHLCTRRFQFSKATKCGGPLVLSPIYQVQAIMHLRKDVVKFPSSLEVDVVDVTAQSQSLTFVRPLTLSEVHSQPDEAFPTMAEILESPEANSPFRCGWLPELKKGRHLVLHRRGTSPMVLATCLKGRRTPQYFLVSRNYSGRLRRRPREFSSVYELYAALGHTPGLLVSVTRYCVEVEEEGLPALSVGEQLEVLRVERVELAGEGQRKTVEALICKRSTETEEDDEEEEEDESEEVSLPLYMQGHFVEKITDSRKITLADLCGSKALPLDVKVVNRDAGMETDPLMGFPSVRLEEATVEPTIEASLPGSPEWTFEIPIRWLNMSLSFTSDPLPWPRGKPPTCHLETIKEVTESFYYELRTLTMSDEPPPPRPPKRTPVPNSKPTLKKEKSLPGKNGRSVTLDMDMLNLDSNKRKKSPAPPIPEDTSSEKLPPTNSWKPVIAGTSGKAIPNTYVKVDEGKKNVDVNDDHDYEDIEDCVDIK